MTPQPNPVDIEAIRASNKIAGDILSHLCREKWAGRLNDAWHWEIPANPQKDTDLLIGKSIRDVNTLCDEIESLRARVKELEARETVRDDLVTAVEELLRVANLRGDNDLPHPADDPKLWTARMQDAWDGLAESFDQLNIEPVEPTKGDEQV